MLLTGELVDHDRQADALEFTASGTEHSLQSFVDAVLARFRDKVLGIALYGSYARGLARTNSDVDILIVLDRSQSLDRDIYNALAEPNGKFAPFFVYLPDESEQPRGLWLEVALDGIVLFDRDFVLNRYLSRLRRAIAQGSVRRKSTHGHAYWVHDNVKVSPQ